MDDTKYKPSVVGRFKISREVAAEGARGSLGRLPARASGGDRRAIESREGSLRSGRRRRQRGETGARVGPGGT
jgi:hypothetical protein